MADELLGVVSEGIMVVPVGMGVEGGVRSLVDENGGSELDQFFRSKAIHDPTHGPLGTVKMYRRRGGG